MSSPQLSWSTKFSYGVGHVLNDLTASMWFSYLLIYLHRIVNFDNAISGYMMLLGLDYLNSYIYIYKFTDNQITFRKLGQISDAISTVFVGFESDRSKKGIQNFGRRKTWHLIG